MGLALWRTLWSNSVVSLHVRERTSSCILSVEQFDCAGWAINRRLYLSNPCPWHAISKFRGPRWARAQVANSVALKIQGANSIGKKTAWKTTWDFILRGGKGSDWRVAFSRLPPSSRCRAREDSTFQLDPFPFVYLCTLKCRNEKRAKQLNNLIIYFSSFALKIDPSNSKLAH